MSNFSRFCFPIFLAALLTSCGNSEPPENSKPPEQTNIHVNLKGTVVFLGDSITHAGHFINDIETFLDNYDPDNVPTVINLGLPSETCTGLSEPDHPFPRPNIHDRIDSALEKTQPDVVFVCYGMNDGIYHPFDEERFAAYQNGINQIIDKVEKTGAALILMTPPPFDPEPLRAKGKLKPLGEEKYAWFEIYENYDTEVLEKYANWILEQQDRVTCVIDLRTPILRYTEKQRVDDPEFTLSNDGVHLNKDGHKLLSKTILEALGKNSEVVDYLSKERHAEIEKKNQILHYAWLSHVGHTRPSTKVGLPLDIAKIAIDLDPSENLTELFNGTDLKNWDGDPDIWSVSENEILGRNTGPVPSSTYLFTKKSYRDFRLIFDVKQTVSPDHSTMHSAVAVLGERFTDKGDNAHGFKGPLLMFCHDWGIWDAYRRNRIEPADHKGQLRIDSEKIGDWNRCEILVIGNRIRFVANGQLVFDFTDQPEMLQASPIGLQIHSNQKPQEYRFRGLVLSENPTDQLVTLAAE